MHRLIAAWALLAITAGVAAAEPGLPENPRVTDIKAVHRHGQTFVTWTDVAEGEAGSRIRYSLYRSDTPITADNLAKAELCYNGVLNNSAKLIGRAYFMKDRLNPELPTCIIEEGGKPLPMWSGLAVHTVTADGKSYYAVVATDEKYQPLSAVEPGQSAITEPVQEKVAPIQPILQSEHSLAPNGKEGLPLTISLHGSSSRGPSGRAQGRFYLYFATAEMGWRDGLPGLFSVYQTPVSVGERLVVFPIDAVENPSGNGVIETCWFGYMCVPQKAAHAEPRVYNFTERRLEWMLRWAMDTFKVDPKRVYSGGQSMGGMASTQFSFRHPEIFAAVYPRLQRVRQGWLPGVPTPGVEIPTSISKGRWSKPAPMHDGKGNYFEHMDSVAWVGAQHGDLPFYGWACGRNDWVEPWKAYIEMVEALTANHHGFAMAWTDGGHSSEGARGSAHVNKYYPAEKFALDLSYPAFGNSSINDDMGSGERVEREVDGKKQMVLKDGDPVGGINLGFDWKDLVDEEATWSATISNELCKEPMTVDVTPRRCQKFKAKAGEQFNWSNSAGGQGKVTADANGLVTVEKLVIKPGQASTLKIWN